MPRKARGKSESGIYHIILRGINRQIIFEDEEDNKKFLQTLDNYKYKSCLWLAHVAMVGCWRRRGKIDEF